MHTIREGYQSLLEDRARKRGVARFKKWVREVTEEFVLDKEGGLV